MLAPSPLVARLPQRLLGHPRGTALAVVGHVDRVWSSSFRRGAEAQTRAFQASLRRLAAGYPVGAAVASFRHRHAQLATDLVRANDRDGDDPAARQRLVELWTAHNDSRNYVVLGDPAVRVAVGPGATA